MKTLATHRIALLFNANKAYDRDILAGVARYTTSTRAEWDLYAEEDYRCCLRGIDQWEGDGILADFDDPAVRAALAGVRVPVVALGGSYRDGKRYPAGVPYVATDNVALVEAAHGHLVEAGLERFALFSMPPGPDNAWAAEREEAFRALMRRDGLRAEIFRGEHATCGTWERGAQALAAWLRTLPTPVGIIGVTDARARQLLQACKRANLAVPDEVALVGIDNDPLAQVFGRIGLSSVRQGAQEMGYQAAKTLHRMLLGVPVPPLQVVAPAGIEVRASSMVPTPAHPAVMRARYFIRQYACRGIKVEQVADYVGASRTSLDQLFKNAVGHSVHEEIMSRKLETAKSMLKGSSASIGAVAQHCGFSSVQYMYTVFRRELGCTPRALSSGARG